MKDRARKIPPPIGPLPPDAPDISATGSAMAGMLAAVTGLALAAVGAFWLIGTQPQSANAAGLSVASSELGAIAMPYPAPDERGRPDR